MKIEESEEDIGSVESVEEDILQVKEKQLPNLRKAESTNSRLILIILALVFLAPFLKGIFSGAAGVLVTIILLPFLLAFALGVAVIGLLISGAACLAAGIPLCFRLISVGILTIGVGFVLIAAGMACLALLAYLTVRWLPVIVISGENLMERFFHRKDGRKI